MSQEESLKKTNLVIKVNIGLFANAISLAAEKIRNVMSEVKNARSVGIYSFNNPTALCSEVDDLYLMCMSGLWRKKRLEGRNSLTVPNGLVFCHFVNEVTKLIDYFDQQHKLDKLGKNFNNYEFTYSDITITEYLDLVYTFDYLNADNYLFRVLLNTKFDMESSLITLAHLVINEKYPIPFTISSIPRLDLSRVDFIGTFDFKEELPKGLFCCLLISSGLMDFTSTAICGDVNLPKKLLIKLFDSKRGLQLIRWVLSNNKDIDQKQLLGKIKTFFEEFNKYITFENLCVVLEFINWMEMTHGELDNFIAELKVIFPDHHHDIDEKFIIKLK